MIYSNSYIQNKPKKLILFATAFYLLFTISILVVMFGFKTEQILSVPCVFSEMKNQRYSNKIFCIATVKNMAGSGIVKGKTYSIRFTTKGEDGRTTQVIFTNLGVDGNSARAVLIAKKGNLPIEGQTNVNGFIEVKNDKKQSLFQQLINK